MIRLSGVSYRSSSKVVEVGNLHIRKGETAIILGPRLSGKSDLLRICIGTKKVDKGTVKLLGEDITEKGSAFLSRRFLDIGFVTQHQTLLDNMTVETNIGLPLAYHVGPVERDLHHAVMELEEKFGIEDIAEKFPNEISFDQARLALMARAVVLGPKVVLLDEPTSGDLDPVGFMKIFDALDSFSRQGITMLITTCSPSLASMDGAILYYLLDGRIFTHDEAANSSNPGVLEFLSQMRTYAKRQMEETTGFFNAAEINSLTSED